MLVIVPWTIRNAGVYDRFVLIASEGGVTFWTGNHPLATGEGDLAANPAIKRADLEFRGGASRPHRRGSWSRSTTATRWRYMRAHPAGGCRLRRDAKRFYHVVPVGPSYALHSTSYRWRRTVPVPAAAAVRGGGRIGASGGARSRRPPLFLLAGSAVLVCLVFFPQERFRIPVIDPR